MRRGVWILSLAATASVWAAGAPALPPAADQQLARDMLKGLVEINTTHAHGSTEAAKAIQGWLSSAGFPAQDIAFVAPPDHPTKGNVVVRYRGRRSGDAVLFLGHLDVVEAKPEDWSVDPFKLTEQEGWFYGRGSIDMKDGDAALVESLVRLRREKFVPEHDIIAAFTADEEAGGDANGPAFLLKEHRELINAALVINLDGGGGATKNGERQFFEVGTSEKTYLTFTLETTSPGGHGSLPGPDNAIYRLANGLGRLETFKFPVMLTSTTREPCHRLRFVLPFPLAPTNPGFRTCLSNVPRAPLGVYRHQDEAAGRGDRASCRVPVLGLEGHLHCHRCAADRNDASDRFEICADWDRAPEVDGVDVSGKHRPAGVADGGDCRGLVHKPHGLPAEESAVLVGVGRLY